MIGLHFFDSGAHTFHKKAQVWAAAQKCDEVLFFKSSEYRAYIDSYAAFLKENAVGIDLYANLDVVGNPALSDRNLRYLREKHGLDPVPVFHHGSDFEWLEKILESKPRVVGFGGTAMAAKGKFTSAKELSSRRAWLDRCFTRICDPVTMLPMFRAHGFGVGDTVSIWRYPWWSVDSSSHKFLASMATVLIPGRKNGQWDYRVRPDRILLGKRTKPGDGFVFLRMHESGKRRVRDWFDEIGLSLEVATHDRDTRAIANIHYFRRMVETIPPWPWPFTKMQTEAGFGL